MGYHEATLNRYEAEQDAEQSISDSFWYKVELEIDHGDLKGQEVSSYEYDCLQKLLEDDCDPDTAVEIMVSWIPFKNKVTKLIPFKIDLDELYSDFKPGYEYSNEDYQDIAEWFIWQNLDKEQKRLKENKRIKDDN